MNPLRILSPTARPAPAGHRERHISIAFVIFSALALMLSSGRSPCAANENESVAGDAHAASSHSGHSPADHHTDPETPSRKGLDFSAWEDVPIQEGGLEKSLYTYASEFVREMTGRADFDDRHPIDNLFSMAYEPHPWQHQPIFKLRHPSLKKLLGVKHERVSFSQLQDEFEELMKLVNQHKEVDKELSNIFFHMSLLDGNDQPPHPLEPLRERLRIVPTEDFRGDKGIWLSIEKLQTETKDKTEAENKLIASHARMRDSFLRGDAGAFNAASAQAIGALDNLGVPRHYPLWRARLDSWSTHAGLFRITGWIYLISALIFTLSYLVGKKIWLIAGTSVLGLGAALNVAALVIRGILAGRTPVSNLYESAVFIVAAIAVFSLIISIYYRARLIGLAGAVLGAFSMGIANSMPADKGIKILPLVDALQSYWLHIHVTSMLCSYALFAIAFFVAGSYVVRWFFMRGRPGFDAAKDPTMLMLDSLNFRVITIGVPILTGGVILGAVWAAEAWGRPWAFDPKETAAAITWMIYAFYLHARLFLGWRGMRSILFSIIGFAAVIFTYLGVSFFLPGLHSYVSGEAFTVMDLIRKIIPGF